MVLASESEVMMLQDRFEQICIVNEKQHIVDGMFLPEFAKEDLGQYTRAYGKPTDIEEICSCQNQRQRTASTVGR
jgi:hypothetical protein